MPRNRGIATHSEAAATPDVNTSFIGTTIVIGNGAAVHIKGAAIDPCTGIISIDAAATHGERSVACNYHTIVDSTCNSAAVHIKVAAGDLRAVGVASEAGVAAHGKGSATRNRNAVVAASDAGVAAHPQKKRR